MSNITPEEWAELKSLTHQLRVHAAQREIIAKQEQLVSARINAILEAAGAHTRPSLPTGNCQEGTSIL